MVLSQLLTAAFSDLGYPATPPQDVIDRITRYINEGYRNVLRTPGLQPLRFATLTVNSTAGYKFLPLGPSVEQIQRIVDSTQNIALQEMTRDEFRKVDPEELSSGTPFRWVDAGYHPVVRQPQASGLWLQSTSALDTQAAGGAGIDMAGNYVPFGVTMNGTTAVRAVPVALQAITAVNLISGANGIVNLLDGLATPGPNTLGTIYAGLTTVLYRSARLWPTPSQSTPYTVDTIVPLLMLAGQGDTPMIPSDFHHVLIEYARLREYERRDDSRAAQAVALYADSIKRLKDRVWNDPDYRPSMRPIGVNGTPSNLGPYFPATGRW